MKTYKAVLFHPQGDYVTDFSKSELIQDVWESIGNMGSRWVFYPICFVVHNETIVDTPEGLEFLKRKRVKTAVRFFKSTWNDHKDEICHKLNNGFPLIAIY